LNGLRVGAVTYLNARPLTFCLSELAPDIEIVVDLPSRLAAGLAEGRLDIALIPSIEYLRQPGCSIVSDACVCCDGASRSVIFYSRVPVERIRTLALDEGSRTSAALARILLAEQFDLRPKLESLPIGSSLEDTDADAVMLIGDRGMCPVRGDFEFVWDLGLEWSRWAGLPFVFAMWVARPSVTLNSATIRSAEKILADARDRGVEQMAKIARLAAPDIGLPEDECLSYLRDSLGFKLGQRERQGLETFYQLAGRHGLGPEQKAES